MAVKRKTAAKKKSTKRPVKRVVTKSSSTQSIFGLAAKDLKYKKAKKKALEASKAASKAYKEAVKKAKKTKKAKK
jgi:hypothetical protein